MSFEAISKNPSYFSKLMLGTVPPKDPRLNNVVFSEIGSKTPEAFETTLHEYPEVLTTHGGYYGRVTALINAVRSNNTDLVDRIIQLGGQVMLEQANLLGQTPVFRAPSDLMLRHLIAKNVNLNVLSTIDRTVYTRWAMQYEPEGLNKEFVSLTVLEAHICDTTTTKQNIKLLLTYGACIQDPTPLSLRDKNKLAGICTEFSGEITMVSSIADSLDTCGLYPELQELILEYTIDDNDPKSTAYEFFQRDTVQKEARHYEIEKAVRTILPPSIRLLISSYEEIPAKDAFKVTYQSQPQASTTRTRRSLLQLDSLFMKTQR